MHFSIIATGLLSIAGLAAAAPTVEKRAETAQQLVTDINALTTQSQNLQKTILAVPTGNTAISKRQIPTPQLFEASIQGLQQLSRTLQDDITRQQGTQPFSDADAQTVCTAYNRMATTQADLFRTFTGKSGLLEGFFLQPVAAGLRQVEFQIDTFSFGVLDVVPVCMESASAKKESLDTALSQAICAYTPAGTLGVNVFC